MLASRTFVDHSASGGVPPGGLWLSLLVEHPLDLNRLHSGAGSRNLDHRHQGLDTVPLCYDDRVCFITARADDTRRCSQRWRPDLRGDRGPAAGVAAQDTTLPKHRR